MRLFNFDEITSKTIEDLKEKGIREGASLDYKRDLSLNDENKYELLKDVSAMANAEGGFIIYGVEQDELDGIPKSFPGIEVQSIDKIENQIGQIIDSGIEDKLHGIRHKGIRREDGRFYYIISIPASHLSPHMISVRTSKPRFYQRINTINVPLNIQQIKELALKMQTVEEKVIQYISKRHLSLAKKNRSFYLFHMIPLYAKANKLDISDYDITGSLLPIGSGNPRHSIDGYMVYSSNENFKKHVLIGRNGAVEFFRSPIVRNNKEDLNTMSITFVENKIIDHVRQVQTNNTVGLVELPALVSLVLYGVNNSVLVTDRYSDSYIFEDNSIECEPLILYDWKQIDEILRHLFYFIWQAYGFPRSMNYNSEGKRVYVL